MRLKRRSSTTASARFACSGGDLPAFESFVDALPSVDETLRARIRLAGGEILDNLVCHALPLKAGVRVRFDMSGTDEPKARLGFFFHSRRFRTWLRAPGPALRSWSPDERRWRGLGLTMVLNLSERVEHRSGPAGDRIVLTF